MPLSDVEKQLLRAMESVKGMNVDGFCKCDVVLRSALKSAGQWTDAAENVFCGEYEANSVAFQFYDQLRGLVLTRFPEAPLAEGRGDLGQPAAPRYTECRITPNGLRELHADIHVTD